MHIVLDTNVLVSGLHNPFGPPGRILDMILSGRFQVVYDDRILNEYLDVLARPELAIEPTLVQAIVGYIRLSGIRLSALPLRGLTLPNSDDSPFAELAASDASSVLITGNLKHFGGLEKIGVTVMSPSAFWESFRGMSSLLTS